MYQMVFNLEGSKMRLFYLLFALIFSMMRCYAWDNSIELGYGKSHDPNHTRYFNSGFLLSSDVFPINHTRYSYLSLNAALGQWYSSAPRHKTLTTVAMALALRFYPFTVVRTYPPYILASAGPAYLSNKTFGENTQGSNFTFQWNGGLGVEFKQIDVNLRMVHYSNAHLTKPDQGFNILYMLSLGYLF